MTPESLSAVKKAKQAFLRLENTQDSEALRCAGYILTVYCEQLEDEIKKVAKRLEFLDADIYSAETSLSRIDS